MVVTGAGNTGSQWPSKGDFPLVIGTTGLAKLSDISFRAETLLHPSSVR